MGDSFIFDFKTVNVEDEYIYIYIYSPTTLVVVHSCVQLRLIKYEWGHIFFQCGSKFKTLLTSLAKNKAVRILRSQSEQTTCGLGFVPPHNIQTKLTKN